MSVIDERVQSIVGGGPQRLFGAPVGRVDQRRLEEKREERGPLDGEMRGKPTHIGDRAEREAEPDTTYERRALSRQGRTRISPRREVGEPAGCLPAQGVAGIWLSTNAGRTRANSTRASTAAAYSALV